MLKIGDKVRFLNENGAGVIAAFQGKNMALVLIEDGFEIPMRVTELVPVLNAAERETEKTDTITNLSAVKEHAPKAEIEGKEAVFLALAPQNQVFSDTFALLLINNTHYQVVYTISVKTNEIYRGLQCGALTVVNFREIGVFNNKEINLWDSIIVQMLFYKPGLYKVQMPLEKHIVIKNNRLQQAHLLKPAPIHGIQAHLFEVADFVAPAAIHYEDYEPTFSATMLRAKVKSDMGVKPKVEDKSPIRTNPKNGYMEIDLHIEELMENYSGLSNGEIVQIQLRHCKKAVDRAIQHHVGKITLIHGVGNGTLKNEVRAMLKSYIGIQFYDAPADKYGYGATEVLLK